MKTVLVIICFIFLILPGLFAQILMYFGIRSPEDQHGSGRAYSITIRLWVFIILLAIIWDIFR
jgi:hypothetical protein